ncbi:MAG: C39 family peptidase [Chthoniobacter sp.]|nr:C39 family peptidase [Chthoniobacter sp.]
MNRLLRRLVVLAFATASAFAAPLDPLFTAENVWAMKSSDFMATAGNLGYRWTSNAQDSARVAGSGATAFGLPVVESVARFESGALKEISVTLYGRGDSGDWPEEKFDTLVRTAADAISAATKVKFTARGKDPTNAVKADGLLWSTPQARYLLEYSKTKAVKTRDIPFRAEFVRLEVSGPEKKLGLLAGAATSAHTAKFSGPAHVKKDAASGDVWIGDVPMVDQGQKGYCVVASVERVMRYYGGSVDANELAQVANTSTEGGTSSDAMMTALKKLGARLKVRVRDVQPGDSIRDLLKLIADYNRAAKKAGVAEVPDPGHMIDVGAVYRAMNGAVLKDVRTKSKSDMSRFQRQIQTHIDQGVPLLWTVMLGLTTEKGIPQTAGGHMRLIIGYNTQKEEILFSDSWGAGHELKRLPLADAWTMTTGAMSIEPL